MTSNLWVEAVGEVVRIDLAGLTDAAAGAVRDVWRDAALPREDRRAGLAGPVVVPVAGPLEATLADLSRRVTLAAIEAHRGRGWMLHAAGVTDASGRVVVLVAPSGGGKTTAARALGHEFGYISDETVAIDPDGTVHAYRKPLSIAGRPGRHKAQRAATELGLLPLPAAPLRAAAIVLLDRRADAPAAPRLEPVDLGDALEELVAQTSHLADMPSPLRTIAAVAAATGGVRRVVYRDAPDLVPIVGSLARTPAGSPVGAVPGQEEPLVSRSSGERPRASGVQPRYTRTHPADAVALTDPDRLAVLTVDGSGHGTVRVLAGTAPALWRAADAASLDDLVAAVIDEHGAPEGMDAAAIVSAAVEELVQEGVLVRVDEPLWRIHDDVAWTDADDRVVALLVAGGDGIPRALDGSAAVVWRAVAEGEATASEIVERVAHRSGVQASAVRADVTAFLGRLLDDGLLRTAARPPL